MTEASSTRPERNVQVDGRDEGQVADDPLARLKFHHQRTMSPELQDRARLIRKINKAYITSWRDEAFGKRLDALIANCGASIMGHGSRERALFVTGASGSGKSTLIERHLKNRPEFQASGDDVGSVPFSPLVSFMLKESAKPHQVASEALERLGLETNSTDDGLLFKTLMKRMMAHGTIYMHIDEMQHAILAQTPITLSKIQEAVKSMLQWKEWPLHAIFSGTEEMLDFFSFSDQLANRKEVFDLEALDVARHADDFRDILHGIAKEQAKLEPVGLLDEEDDTFIHRAMRASNYQFGSTIQLMRSACVVAVAEGSKTLSIEHFARAFYNITAWKPERNHFLNEHWMELPPGKFDASKRAPRRKRK